MNKMQVFIVVVTGIALGFASSAWSQPTAERTLPEQGYLPDVPVMVSIQVTGDPGEAVVVETPPGDWAISDVHLGGTVDEGVITWSVRLLSSKRPKTVAYWTTPPPKASGEAIFSGRVDDLEIGGMSELALNEPRPLGIFQNHLDIGAVEPPGEAAYESETGEYTIQCCWNEIYEYHFVYKELSGAFTLRGRIRAEGNNPANAGFIIVADDLKVSSSYFSAWVEVRKRAYSMWVQHPGNPGQYYSRLAPPSDNYEGFFEIVRVGNVCEAYYIDPGTGEPIQFDTQVIDLVDPVYVGIGAWAAPPYDEPVLAYFNDLKLEIASSAQDWELYR
ncbi:MAG: hypothetical protein ABIH23_01525 [bacterium]